MKCVMIIDESLPLGLIANTAAVLGISLGAQIEGIVGPDVQDSEGKVHRGITRLSIPLLKGSSELIRDTREKLVALDAPDLYYVDFCDAAQKSKQYEDYRSKIERVPVDELRYLGIAMCGPEKHVRTLTGSIGLLR